LGWPEKQNPYHARKGELPCTDCKEKKGRGRSKKEEFKIPWKALQKGYLRREGGMKRATGVVAGGRKKNKVRISCPSVILGLFICNGGKMEEDPQGGVEVGGRRGDESNDPKRAHLIWGGRLCQGPA